MVSMLLLGININFVIDGPYAALPIIKETSKSLLKETKETIIWYKKETIHT